MYELLSFQELAIIRYMSFGLVYALCCIFQVFFIEINVISGYNLIKYLADNVFFHEAFCYMAWLIQ